MSDSIYATPEADVEVQQSDEHDYYVVGPTKFYLLSVLTLNLYHVYWFYRNWRLIETRERSGIWPVPRGFFFIFFTHALLTDINEAIKTQQRKYDWQPTAIATVFVLLVVGANILDRAASLSVGSPTSDLIFIGLTLVTPLLLLQAQRAINFVCNDPNGETNAKFSLANWVWMIIGGLFWLMILLGLYFIVFEPELLLE